MKGFVWKLRPLLHPPNFIIVGFIVALKVSILKSFTPHLIPPLSSPFHPIYNKKPKFSFSCANFPFHTSYSSIKLLIKKLSKVLMRFFSVSLCAVSAFSHSAKSSDTSKCEILFALSRLISLFEGHNTFSI
jgi:hypothetical protein